MNHIKSKFICYYYHQLQIKLFLTALLCQSKMWFQLYYFTIALTLSVLLLPTINGIILSSSVESENGHVTVCPDTTITFTCSDTLVLGMRWFALPLLDEGKSPGLGSSLPEIGEPTVVEDVFTITLVARELMMGDNRGNYTSTLDVVVNDRIQNGINVTCFTLSSMASLLIFKQGLFYCIVGCKIFWG